MVYERKTIEAEKKGETREEQRSAGQLSWHKNEMMCLKDLGSPGNADEMVCFSLVSQSTSRLGLVGNPPFPLL